MLNLTGMGLRWAILLLLSGVALIAVCLRIGNQQPVPEAIKFIDYLVCNLDNCDHMPLTGSTARSAVEYRRVFEEQALSENGAIDFEYYGVAYSRRRPGTLFATVQKLFVVVATREPGLHTLGDFMAHFGEPCAVTITESNVALQFPNFYMIVAHPTNQNGPVYRTDMKLSPRMRVNIIRMRGHVFSCANPVLFSSSNTITPWSGFRHVRDYVVEAGDH